MVVFRCLERSLANAAVVVGGPAGIASMMRVSRSGIPASLLERWSGGVTGREDSNGQDKQGKC